MAGYLDNHSFGVFVGILCVLGIFYLYFSLQRRIQKCETEQQSIRSKLIKIIAILGLHPATKEIMDNNFPSHTAVQPSGVPPSLHNPDLIPVSDDEDDVDESSCVENESEPGDSDMDSVGGSEGSSMVYPDGENADNDTEEKPIKIVYLNTSSLDNVLGDAEVEEVDDAHSITELEADDTETDVNADVDGLVEEEVAEIQNEPVVVEFETHINPSSLDQPNSKMSSDSENKVPPSQELAGEENEYDMNRDSVSDPNEWKKWNLPKLRSMAISRGIVAPNEAYKWKKHELIQSLLFHYNSKYD